MASFSKLTVQLLKYQCNPFTSQLVLTENNVCRQPTIKGEIGVLESPRVKTSRKKASYFQPTLYALRGNRTPGGSMATTQVTTTPLMHTKGAVLININSIFR